MDYVEYFIPHKETYFIHSLFKNMNSNVFQKTITVLLSVTQPADFCTVQLQLACLK